MACLPTKLNFLANGCVLGQNARKETPFKIQFYCQDNITRPINTFFNAWQWHQFDLVSFLLCLLSNWLFAEKFSNCSNSLNFEAKINCNTTKPNVPKWRKRCTGLKLDLVPFNGPQMQFLSDHNFEGPCTIHILDIALSQKLVVVGRCFIYRFGTT